MNTLLRILVLGISLSTFFGCSRELSDCNGYTVDQQKLLGIRETLFTGGPHAALIVPNPIDAGLTTLSSGTLESSMTAFQLPDLISPSRLETNFLKIRLHEITDSLSILAAPGTNGNYEYPLQDAHYSEVMAYHSLSATIRYVETLGFSLVKTRPLYVMVRAENPDGGSGTEVNAIYTHNYFNSSKPRTLELFGDTTYAPGMDRDIYWHEFGHYMNESISREVGMDLAGDAGAVFTEGAALHECIADYVSESLGNKGYIGRWIARNFSNIPPGEPLRTAESKGDDLNNFNNVALFSNDGKNLDRYRMAEWCSRVLWNLREQFVKEDPSTGALFADRLMFSAISLLKKDTSISQFRAALFQADNTLHCGLHNRSIEEAFQSKGFSDTGNLGAPLQLKASSRSVPSSVDSTNNAISFAFAISNPTGQTARNVRIYLESPNGSILPTVYMQAFGDLPPGATIQVGTQSGLDSNFSVLGTVNASGPVRYRLRIKIENGPDTVVEGQASL
jgi:hypothetical protein